MSILLVILPFLYLVSAAVKPATPTPSSTPSPIPTIPPVYDPSYPNGTRCYDYCVLLGSPNQLCPGHPDDIECLCNVYNVRLPAVSPILFIANLV
jgi:hypothetical protein